MNVYKRLMSSALIAGAALGYSVAGAAAAVVCDSDGDCWHAREAYTYPSDAQVVVHPDDWKWGANEKHRWREHEGRGYWMKGEWRAF